MDALLKTAFINKWKKYFEDAPLPVALFFSDNLHHAEPAAKNKSHHCIIGDITRVFHGQSLAFNANNIGCGGGLKNCGFTDKMRPGFEFFLSYGKEGKMKGERYKKDPETVTEWMINTPPITAPAPWLIAKPFDQLEQEDEPEVIVFFATPDILAGLFTLANYDRSDLYGVKSPFCAGCGSLVQYPWLENKKNRPDCILGMFDSSARPYIKAGELSFAIPMKRFVKLVGYMDECFLITETWEVMKGRISGSSKKVIN